MEGPAFRLLQDPLLCVYHRDRQLMGAAIDIAQLEAGLLAGGAEWLAVEQQLVEMAGLQRGLGLYGDADRAGVVADRLVCGRAEDLQLIADGSRLLLRRLDRTRAGAGWLAMLLEGFSCTSSTAWPLGRSVKTRLPSASV